MNQEKEKNEILEDTSEIKIGDGNIGKYNLILFAIITTICLIYLFTHFSE